MLTHPFPFLQGAAEPFYTTPEQGEEFPLEGPVHFCQAIGTGGCQRNGGSMPAASPHPQRSGRQPSSRQAACSDRASRCQHRPPLCARLSPGLTSLQLPPP